MTLADELAYMNAHSLAENIRQKTLSPVEVVEAFISRIEERNPTVNAFVYYGFDHAKLAAKRAENEVMSGAHLGPLHGVPTAIKDLFRFKTGWVGTAGGIRALKDRIDTTCSSFTERMEKAGAIHLGKTNSPTLGFRGVCDNYLFGPSRNPFDVTRNTGGSSGGSAGAVADGLVPISGGADGGGSIRIPSSWSGVFGYKASAGRIPNISRPNAFSGANPFVSDGVMTRTVEDSALALSVLAGYDPRDPFSIDGEVDYLAATQKSIRGMKVAYSPDLDVFPIDPEVSSIVANAACVFEEAGAIVQEVKLGLTRHHSELSDLWCRMAMLSCFAFLDKMRSQGIDLLVDYASDLPPEIHDWADKVRGMTATDTACDQIIRTEIYDSIQKIFDEYDYIVTPTLSCLPVLNHNNGNTLGPTSINGEDVNPLIGWCLTHPFNFTGHPAASIPAGLAGHLPVGLQIVGRRNSDCDVIAASATFQNLRPWQDSYKICQARQLEAK